MTLWKLIKQTSKTFFWEKNNKPKNRTLGKNHIDRKHAEEKKLLKGTEKKCCTSKKIEIHEIHGSQREMFKKDN